MIASKEFCLDRKLYDALFQLGSCYNWKKQPQVTEIKFHNLNAQFSQLIANGEDMFRI